MPSEPKNPALLAVEGLVKGGLTSPSHRIIGEVMGDGVGIALAYEVGKAKLAVVVADVIGTQEMVLDSSGLHVLVSALVDMGLADRRKA